MFSLSRLVLRNLQRVLQEKQLKLTLESRDKKKSSNNFFRIGKRDIDTGKYETIYQDGGKNISGQKIFDSSPMYGTPVRGTYNNTSIAKFVALDQLSFQPLIQEEEEVKPNIINSLKDTYIYFFLDTSGSMSGQIPDIEESIELLIKELSETIYNNDEVATRKYIKTFYDSTETWVRTLAYDKEPVIEKEEIDVENPYLFITGDSRTFYGGKELIDDSILDMTPNKAIIFSFINESHSAYHYDDKNKNYEPSFTFLKDFEFFKNKFPEREFFKGVIICVDYNDNDPIFQRFKFHLVESIGGTGRYSSLQPLSDYGIQAKIGVPADTEPDVYLEMIKEFLELKNG